MKQKTILSISDYNGSWSAPYLLAGYRVIRIDPKHLDRRTNNLITLPWTAQQCLAQLTSLTADFGPIHGILAAPPCTHFSSSGAQYWKAKDADGRTASALECLDAINEIVKRLKPVWYAIENPVGRIPTLRPDMGKPHYFQPFEYGDAYTKKTGLWGCFNRAMEKTPVAPIRACKQGSWLQQLGGKSEKTKTLRSNTPEGFAKAFFNANK